MYSNMSSHEWLILILNVLCTVIIIHDYLKRKRMGKVLLKSKSKINFLEVVLGIGFLMSVYDFVYSLFQFNKDLAMIIDNSKGIFFYILMYYSIIKTNRITEKGVVLSYTLFTWQNIESWGWSDNPSQVLIIDASYERKHKKNKENVHAKWEVHSGEKESVERILKEYIPEKNRCR